jgi:hypothetical protein
MVLDSPRPLDLQQSRHVDIIDFNVKPDPQHEIKEERNCASDSYFCLKSGDSISSRQSVALLRVHSIRGNYVL